MIESLFMKFTPDYLSNLKMILETACDLTSAETGYILRYNDKNELDAFVAYDSNTEANYYSYIIERTMKILKEYLQLKVLTKKQEILIFSFPETSKPLYVFPYTAMNPGTDIRL